MTRFKHTKVFGKIISEKFRDSYTTNEFVGRVGLVLTSSTKLHALLEETAIVIANMLKSSHVTFIINPKESKPLSVGTRKLAIATADIKTLIASNISSSNVVQVERIEDDGLRRLLYGYGIHLLVPLQTSQHMFGYVALGESLRSGYTPKDIRALDTIADELVIAIQNALSLQEVREINDTLQQRIDAATEELRRSNEQLRSLDQAKDEFVSMASHQLRTPLTSVKGYISMVLEGDVGKVSADQKKLLSEAFTSSERMVHLINDFLNVSRIQTGKFMIDKHEVNLTKLVKQEVDSLKSIAESRDLKLKVSLPKHAVEYELDEGKIRQVIMNFIDNAIFYSRPGGTIVVKLTETSKDVRVEIKDSGIGVPLKQQKKLFTKFFRAENARTQRPDGTGVGLFLAKKVIDGHKGKILFSSQEGKGSLFGFSLPVDNTNKTSHKKTN